MTRVRQPIVKVITTVVMASLLLATLLSVVARPAAATTPPKLDLRVLLIGDTATQGSTTAAWASSLSTDGVAYTLVTASGPYSAETVTLPSLTSGSTGNFNGVVIADAPAGFAAGQLDALSTYESQFGVRQIDGSAYPSPSLGQTAVSGASQTLDNTTASLTAAGLAGLPGLKGIVPFAAGTFGTPATADAGAPFTPWMENAAGQFLAGVYQHPGAGSDLQAGVSELSLNFNYNANQLQWLLLAPGLIDWVTQDTHLGLSRNYFGQDVDDVFIADNEWSSQFQCTPGAQAPPDYTCPAGVGNNPVDTPPDVQMSAADVAYVTNWEAQTGIKLNLAFNAVGACSGTTASSTAVCNGSYAESGAGQNGKTYTDPGFVVDSTMPNDAAFVDALLGAKADFNWMTHTWSHQFLGCNVWQPQALTSVTPNASGGSFVAGSYSYEITAATAYGESEPSLPKGATVAANGSVSLSWPDATNGTAGPTLAQEEASHDAGTGTGFWGYDIYRLDPGTTDYRLVGQVAEAGTTPTYSFTDTGATTPGSSPDSTDTFPTATNPGIDCSSATGSWEPAVDPTNSSDVSIGTEIGLDQAFATANALPNYTPADVVTGEHSGLENPNMTAALAGVGVTTFASDASRQSVPYTLGTARSAPRYPTNIYYNAGNWTDELNEYNTLYASATTQIGTNSANQPEFGHCVATSSTTCLSAPATQTSLIASETGIMMSHILANNPRVDYAHQSNLIGSANPTNGYTLLTTLSAMQSLYNSYENANAPLTQMTDVTEAQTLAQQSAWATADAANTVTATLDEATGAVTVTNSGGAPVDVPLTTPQGTTVSGGAPYGESYAGQLSTWTSVTPGAPLVVDEHVTPTIMSAASATSTVGTPFTTTITSTGEPSAAITETGALPSGITWTDNGDGTATLAGTPGTATGGSYPITITATNPSGTATQAFTLTNVEAPAVTSAPTATFYTGINGTYTVTTTGYPLAAITETGALPAGVSFTDNGNGTATIAGATTAAGTFPVSISATNSSGSVATLALTLMSTTSSPPTITSSTTAFFTLNQPGAFAVTTTGTPIASLTEVGALPAGLTVVDEGNGNALISGTPTATGTASLAFTASNGRTPNATQTLSIIVGSAPAVTSGASTTFVAGAPGTFTVTTSGYPAPSLGETGTLPSGITWTDNGNGTATLAGTPGTSTGGSYPITITATNGTGSVTQSFTLTDVEAPAVTSAPAATFYTGINGTYTVTTTGYPLAAITETGALPAGTSFTDNGNGTATIAGATTATAGSFPVSISATNGTGGAATLALTLTVATVGPPTITSGTTAFFTLNQPGAFAVTTTGGPIASLTEVGALPAGLTVVDEGNGNALISGTPTATGTASLTFKATNGQSPDASQPFTIIVGSAPAVTSGASTTFVAGAPGTFTVTTSGYPAPSLGETGTLPSGMTWTDNGDGTATLAGTPDAVTSPTAYPLTIQATDGTGSVTQSFTLTVAPAPVSGGTIPPVGTPPAVTTPTPTSALAGGDRLAATPDGQGYWVVGTNGSVTPYGAAANYGSMAGHVLNRPIVGVAATPDGKGYWLVATDGGIFSFGDAQFYGSTGNIKLNKPIVGITGTPDGKGYWMVASDGGVFSFGDAQFYGSTGNIKLNKPIVGMASDPNGTGYWLVASDGGIFTFGDAQFYGSTGNIKLNKPVMGMAADRSGHGYWLVASDGGIFTFGDAGFYGSGGSTGRTAVGLIASPNSPGYALVDLDGTRTNFGW